MSIKADRILGLFRNCHNLGSHRKKDDEKFDVKNDRTEFSNDVKSLERFVSRMTLNTARKLDFSSLETTFERSESTFVKAVKVSETDSRDALSDDLKIFFSACKWRSASMEHAHLYRMMAVSCLESGNQLDAVQLLTESHAVILQQQVYHRHLKTELRNKYCEVELEPGLDPTYMDFTPESVMRFDSMRTKLAEMPEEWYVIQLTIQYNALDYRRANGTIMESTHPLHITVLPTGPSVTDPFCITLPIPNNENYDAVREIVNILKNNKAELEALYTDNALYWKMREKQNTKLKAAVLELEHSWLREWRILLVADPLKITNSVKEMRDMIDKLIADDLTVVYISDSVRWLLRKIATCACYLNKTEIARAVLHVLRDNKKLANNIILSIHGKLSSSNEIRNERRKTLIMIVDESIDHIPFESMEILKTHPVTRFPSFHIAYAMFKEHEDTIVKGCKIVKKNENFGSYIVNPDRNLTKMEKRIKLFINYWLPDWDGTYGIKPTEAGYTKVLTNHEVLMYTGHGSGIQYLPGEKIEKLRIRSSVLLFGCSSVKLFPIGGIFPPRGVSNQYLIACSPCILGMLWEVTDGDIDRMTSSFISDWIPSRAERPWADVDLNKWVDGVLQFKPTTSNIMECTNEPEMLRAIAKSKEICTQHMTAAAIVVRGLPLRLES